LITEREAHVVAGKEAALWLAANRDDPSQQAEWDPDLYERLWLDERDPPDILISDPGSRFSMRRMCSSLAAKLLRENGWAVDDLSVRKVERAVAAAYQRAALVLRREAQGIFESGADPFGSEPSVSATTGGGTRQSHLRHSAPNSSPRSITKLSELIEWWWRESLAAGRKPSTYESYKNTFTNFQRFLAHDDATKVTMHDVVAFKEYRLQTPSAKTGKRVSAKTVKDSDLSALKAVFGWAVHNGYLDDNVAAKVTLKLSKSPKHRSSGFTDDEANALLSACLGHKIGREHPKTFTAKRWVPWICAFTGARVGEIGQLRKQDVTERGGVWVLRVTPDAGTVKTNEAREIPLHSQVIDLGFPDFVRAAPEGHLFLNVSSDQDPLGPLQGLKNRLAEFARSVVADPRVLPNHGWRHRFKTVGMEAGIPPRILDAIQGHAARTASDGYGDVTLKTMIAEIAKLPRYADR
jgi:integrase